VINPWPILRLRRLRLALAGAGLGLAATLVAGEPLKESAPRTGRKPDAQGLNGRQNPSSLNSGSLNRGRELPSLGPGITAGSLPETPTPIPTTTSKADPELQKRLMRELDKRRNWLIERSAQINSPGATPNAFRSGTSTGIGTGTQAEDRSTENMTPAQISADRIRRATEPQAGRAEATDPENRSTERPGEVAENEDPEKKNPDGSKKTKEEADRPGSAFVSGKLSDFERPLSNKSAIGADLMAAPRSVLDDRMRENTAARAAAFGDILGDIGSQGGGGNGGFGKGALDRNQQFQAFLAGPEPAPVVAVANPLANPAVNGAAAGFRPGLSTGPERVQPLLLPGQAPQAAPAAPTRLAPRPVFLPIPTRGF
jgi:hypothetical protein